MALTHGSGILVYGAPTSPTTGIIIQGGSLSQKNGVNIWVENELGQRVYNYQDDLIQEVSYDFMIKSGVASPEPGQTFIIILPNFPATTYLCESVDWKYSNKGCATGTIKGTTSQYITLGAV